MTLLNQPYVIHPQDAIDVYERMRREGKMTSNKID